MYREGDPATHIWFVKRGTVVVTREVQPGRDVAVAIRGPGDFLGMEALVVDAYPTSARTTATATLCGAPRAEVRAWLGAPSSPARLALEQVLRMRLADPDAPAVAVRSAAQRVAAWLIEHDGACGSATGVPRRDVAAILAITPETLARELSRLARAGVIEVTRTAVRLVDRERLRAMAAPGDAAERAAHDVPGPVWEEPPGDPAGDAEAFLGREQR